MPACRPHSFGVRDLMITLENVVVADPQQAPKAWAGNSYNADPAR